MFVALEDLRRKVILFEPPDCKARDEARAAVLDQGSNMILAAPAERAERARERAPSEQRANSERTVN